MPDPTRVGSVAYNRAHGLNKAAGGPGKSGSSGGGGNKPSGGGGSSAPKPSGGGGGGGPKPTPYTGSKPSGGGGGGASAAKSAAQTYKNTASGMSVKEQRAQAQAAGMSMKDWKSQNQGGAGKVGVKGVQGGNQNGNVNQLFNPGGNTGSAAKSVSSGSPWERFSAEFSQDDHNAFTQQLWDNTSEISGLKKGPKYQAAQWTEKGFKMDANAPMVLPKDVQKYGFKPGDQFFDAEGYTPHAENAHMDPSMGGAITGKIAYFKKDGTPMYEVAHDANPNWDKYQDGKERMSSEGLYQDKYNVGYGGPDDEGDMYASQAALGSIASYFKGYNNGEQTFSQAYHNFVEGDRTGGYAGDVLKMIDQGRMKVTDDQYNRIVVDAQNYDWQKRGEIAGRDSGDGFYDARAGGQSANASLPAVGAESFNQFNQFNAQQQLPNSGSTSTNTRGSQVSVQGVQSAPTNTFNPFGQQFKFNPSSFNFNQ